MSLSLLLVSAALAADPVTLTLAPAAGARGPFTEWTSLATVSADSTFAAGARVECKARVGCRLADAEGHIAPVRVARDDGSLRVSSVPGTSYAAFGQITQFTGAWKLGDKEWQDDWIAPK